MSLARTSQQLTPSVGGDPVRIEADVSCLPQIPIAGITVCLSDTI